MTTQHTPKSLKALRKIEDRESIGIAEIVHSQNCGTSVYYKGVCFDGDKPASVPCLLVRTRAAIAKAQGDVKP